MKKVKNIPLFEKEKYEKNKLGFKNKEDFIKFLDSILQIKSINELKGKISDVKSYLDLSNSEIVFEEKKQFLLGELEQILKSQTLERAKYYVKRLIKSLTEEKTGKINDINLNRWKEYNEIITDSLWIFDKRDTSGAHLGWYWGNFIPQIPRQMMLRYTKKGDWVLDPFLGSGTTLIECRRLGRNGIGIELNPEVAKKAKQLIEKEENKYNVITDVIVADSSSLDFKEILERNGLDKIQLAILHPPYHDIIKFSDNPKDLSNAKSVEEFLQMIEAVAKKTYEVLEKGRYLVLVIGDKYSKGEWIPLGFYTMEKIKNLGFKLKSIVVKNFEETRGKRNQKELWRYRALVGGFYVFKHEYIFIFQKK